MNVSPVVASDVVAWRDRLARGSTDACEGDAGDLVDLIAALEDLTSTARAVQAEAAVAFDAARRASEAAAGVASRLQGRGVGGEVALARKESAARGQSLLGLARVLVVEMPHTLDRLRDGTLNEFRATILARETGCLNAEQRAAVDEELCCSPAALVGVGTRELAGRVRRRVALLDPAAVARRNRKAESERGVSLRPAPDTMAYLTTLIPMAQGVAVYATLQRDADAKKAAGDDRSRRQLTADLVVSRLTGVPDTGVPAQAPAVPVTVNITLPAPTLAGGHAPALLTARGVAGEVVPAETARLLLAHSITEGVGAWFRQLYANPLGRLVALTSRQRTFPDGLAELLQVQGHGICATPWCDAPIQHSDHIVPVEDDGATDHHNGQGLCAACNHAKQAGWRQSADSPIGRPAVTTTTPTGHRYHATAPAPPGWGDHGPPRAFMIDIQWLRAA
ncbi:HNH endonuclease [Nocardioides sp. Root190]|uniref:HNH endonuclease n=1 Tax=Nocardioides sp. Root190 TaxID=1736488 RepID=UPI00138F5523|nr:HNH endonuclease signature motif containing protein [Nocardioides sp. Root190]